MSKLTHAQQHDRFGMSPRAADALVAKARTLPVDTQAAAQLAWQNLSDDLRENKGQPFVCPQHPEAIRLKILVGLLDGLPVNVAVEAARTFAFRELDQ